MAIIMLGLNETCEKNQRNFVVVMIATKSYPCKQKNTFVKHVKCLLCPGDCIIAALVAAVIRATYDNTYIQKYTHIYIQNTF